VIARNPNLFSEEKALAQKGSITGDQTAREGEVMKSLGYVSLVFLLAFSLLTACETTRKLTSSISGSSSTDELLAQVPSSEQTEVHEAAFNLQLAEEKLNLAKMKTELASLRKKLADYQEDVADKYQEAAEVKLDLAKLETVDKANLGEKEDNINKIADLKAIASNLRQNGIPQNKKSTVWLNKLKSRRQKS